MIIINNIFMSELFNFIKDAFEVFTDAYKYAELDFYKLKSEILALLSKAKNKGYGIPDYCSLSIDVVNKYETSVVIEAYYNKTNGKYQKFKKTLDLGSLKNVPKIVKERLDKVGTVTIKISDINNLYTVSENDIVPTIEFKTLYNFSLRNAKSTPVKKELHITDELFYYKVILVYIYETGEKEMRVKYFGNIHNIPIEVIEKISSNEDKSCYIDVTNSNI